MPVTRARLDGVIEKSRRHVRWVRERGVGVLLEEDNLDPRTRVRAWRNRSTWLRRHGVPQGDARPLWVVGLQRSGTNMVVRGFEMGGPFAVYNENSGKAFDGYRLRPDDDVRALIGFSRHRHVLFKPLCDSHRVGHLLDHVHTGRPGRALWVHRGVDGRVRSAVDKFGPANRDALAAIAGDDDDRWEAGGLSDDSRALIGRLSGDGLTPHEAAALFWLVRNRLFFELGLDRRDDVLAVSYDRLVSEPETTMRRVCAFLDEPDDPALWAHVDQRAVVPRPVDLRPELRSRCEDMERRLDACSR